MNVKVSLSLLLGALQEVSRIAAGSCVLVLDAQADKLKLLGTHWTGTQVSCELPAQIQEEGCCLVPRSPLKKAHALLGAAQGVLQRGNFQRKPAE